VAAFFKQGNGLSEALRTVKSKNSDWRLILSISLGIAPNQYAVSSYSIVRLRQNNHSTMVSVYLNTPPANKLDEWIVARVLLLTGLTPTIEDPRDGVTSPPFHPTENYHFETKGLAVIVALSVCMVVFTLVTFLRVGIRLFVHGVRFGADDWLIIPAYLFSMAYPALQIAMVQSGGAGKHFYDITYQGYFYYKSMSEDDPDDSPSRITNVDLQLASSVATVFYVYLGLVKMSMALFNI
jgi:hypothetical protein